MTEYVGALRGTAWEGCTLQHLLDMRAGTRFDEEDYDDPDSDGVLIDEISGYRTHRRPDQPPDTYAWIAGLDNDREHGSAFKYRSILTDVLAWAAVEATGMRFPDLFADRIWSRIGAERDAEIIVDAAGFAAAEGGFCTTLRDLARFGLMHLQHGEIGGRRVVPAAWIDRLLARDDELIAAFESDSFPGRPDAFYHDAWWVWDGAAGIYSGYGINGQQLLIHHPSRTVHRPVLDLAYKVGRSPVRLRLCRERRGARAPGRLGVKRRMRGVDASAADPPAHMCPGLNERPGHVVDES